MRRKRLVRGFKLRKWDKKLIRICAAGTLIMLFALVILPLLLIMGFHNSEEDTDYKDYLITVYRIGEGHTETLELENYVSGVVAGEMPGTFETEALKAQAVAARTYGLSKAIRGEEKGNPDEHLMAPLCDSVHCQVYRSEEELKSLKGEGWMSDGWQKIKEAVKATEGEVMYYEGKVVEQPLFHSASGGMTENSEDVFVSALPYLRSVESPFEEEAPYNNESISISFSSFAKKAGERFGAADIGPETLKILSRSEGGRVKEIQVGDKVLSGRDIRDLVGLRSADFSMSAGDKDIVFTSCGYGHGVGMSQWGANGMAKAGYAYKDILKHYYTGVSIEKIH